MTQKWYCRGIMDPRDGHRECPTCLGMAHLMDDIENPCVASVELPVEERDKGARWVEQSVRAGAVQPLPAQLNERGHTSNKGPWKRRHEHTPVCRRGSGKKQAPKSLQNPAGQHDDTQLQILAAIRGLSERLGRVEAQYPATTAKASRHWYSKESSPDRLPSYQEENVVHPDILSLYAQNCLFLKSDEQSDGAAGLKQPKSTQFEGESNLSNICDSEPSTMDVISKVSKLWDSMFQLRLLLQWMGFRPASLSHSNQLLYLLLVTICTCSGRHVTSLVVHLSSMQVAGDWRRYSMLPKQEWGICLQLSGRWPS